MKYELCLLVGLFVICLTGGVKAAPIGVTPIFDDDVMNDLSMVKGFLDMDDESLIPQFPQFQLADEESSDNFPFNNLNDWKDLTDDHFDNDESAIRETTTSAASTANANSELKDLFPSEKEEWEDFLADGTVKASNPIELSFDASSPENETEVDFSSEWDKNFFGQQRAWEMDDEPVQAANGLISNQKVLFHREVVISPQQQNSIAWPTRNDINSQLNLSNFFSQQGINTGPQQQQQQQLQQPRSDLSSQLGLVQPGGGGVLPQQPQPGVGSQLPGLGLTPQQPQQGLGSQLPGLGLTPQQPQPGVGNQLPGLGLTPQQPQQGLGSQLPGLSLTPQQPQPGVGSQLPGLGLTPQQPSSGVGSSSNLNSNFPQLTS